MQINFVDIDLYAPAARPAPTEVELLRDTVNRLEAKRAYDVQHIRNIWRILRAAGMPASSQGTISKHQVTSLSWRVLLLAKTAIGLCRERDATRDLIGAVDGLLDYRRRNRYNWQTEKAEDHFRRIRIAREAISLPDEGGPITAEAIAADVMWELEQQSGWNRAAGTWDTSIYSRLDVPISIDFGGVAHRPGVPYLTNGAELLELGGLTTVALLNAFVAGFNSRKGQVPA